MEQEEGTWHLTMDWAATTMAYGWTYQQACSGKQPNTNKLGQKQDDCNAKTLM